MLAVGDTVEAMVLDVDPRQKRISLGMKQLEPNPFASLKEKYPPGTVVKGVVRNIADFGVFVEIEEGIDGMVHMSDLSWTQRVKHPSELYQKGDEVEAVVLNIDSTTRRRSRSASSSWCPIRGIASPTTTRSGKIVERKVIKVLDFGAFVEIEKGVEGLIHVSEFSEERVEDPKNFVKPGQIAQGGDHQRRHGRAEDRPVVPGRRPRRGGGRRAGLLRRRAHRHPGRRHAREAGRADRQAARETPRSARSRPRARRGQAAGRTATRQRRVPVAPLGGSDGG